MVGPGISSDVSVAVAVVTYRRTERLADLLPLLVRQAADVSAGPSRWSAHVLVVDNDPDASAAPVVAAYGTAVRYEHQPRPGISAARNHALDRAGTDLLAFIDDDELPCEGWLAALLHTMASHGADAVAGPVRSRPEGPVDPFVRAGGFHERAHRAGLSTGDVIQRAATNNLLLDLRTVRRLGLAFDERFGLSGGEDSLFTGALVRTGGRIVWCVEAEVHDLVPTSRLTPEYVVARTASLANASVLAELALATSGGERLGLRTRTAAVASVRAVVGAARLASGTLTGSLTSRARGRRALARSRGSLSAVAGHRVMAYARAVTPAAAPDPGTSRS